MTAFTAKRLLFDMNSCLVDSKALVENICAQNELDVQEVRYTCCLHTVVRLIRQKSTPP